MVKHRVTADWYLLRQALWMRCLGRCEVSGRVLDFYGFDAHHRRPKGMGGTSRGDTDLLSNLLALDPVVHNGGSASVHGRRGWSEVRGYLVPKHVDDVGGVPLWVAGEGRWVLLSVGGWYVDTGVRAVPVD